MNATAHAKRGPFQGVAEIVAFNWPWYVAGLLVVLAAVAALFLLAWPDWFRVMAISVVATAVAWSLASLAVSHWVYDRSALRDWLWIAGALPATPRRWCNLHCGLDESSPALRQLFPAAEGLVFDIFDPEEMTEPSLARARALHRGARARATGFRRLPLPDGSLDAVFLLFAAHELRTPSARRVLYVEVRRVLSEGGTVVVAEHLRDVPNFCAFGPGALHFFGRGEWRRVFTDAGFPAPREFGITPFVRVFVLRRLP